MASDKTEPKTAFIFKIMVLAVTALVLGRFGLISYFKKMTDDELQRKVLSVRAPELDDLRKREQEAVGDKVDKAMARFAAEGRGPNLQPQQSTDDSPLKGWQQLPREVHGFAGDAGSQGGGVKIAPEDAGAPLHEAADAAAQHEAGAAAEDAGKPKEDKPKRREEPKQP